MNAIIVELLTVAKKLNNYAADATGGGLWIDTTHYRVTCPASKRWFFIGGTVKRDASQTVQGHIFDSSDDIIDRVLNESAATAHVVFPEIEFDHGGPRVLDAGEYIELLFGGAQGVAAFASCTVLEIDV